MKSSIYILGLLLIFSLIIKVKSTPESAEGNGGVKQPNVLEIVEAISKVQKNVTNNPSNKHNVKVANGVLTSESANDTESLSLDLLEILQSSAETTSTSAPSTQASTDFEDPAINEIDTGGYGHPSDLIPPSDSILSYDGIFAWFNWVVAMRDPRINPAGTSSWREIIETGVFSIFEHFNPFRGFIGRTLGSESITSMLAVYNNRQKVLAALATNEIQPDSQSILDYALNLEKNKATNKLDEGSEVEDKANVPLPAGIVALADILNGAPFQVGIPTAALKPDTDLPLDVLAVNSVLKWIYILIPLLFLPLSGIENFFLAPLPPNLDTVPGVLRLLGLQALLGPDYVLDYDAAYDPAYDTPGDEVGEPLSEEAEPDFSDYDYDGPVRRKDSRTKNTKKKKLVSSYSEMSESMKAPPSRYGMSSYTSYKYKAAKEK